MHPAWPVCLYPAVTEPEKQIDAVASKTLEYD